MLNKEIEAHHIDEHHKRTFRYNSILSDSKFSFCPEGAGPNTLRFWESVAVGSIPVIFSTDLHIFDSAIGREIIENCVVVQKGSLDKIFQLLESFDISQLKVMSQNIINAYDKRIKYLNVMDVSYG